MLNGSARISGDAETPANALELTAAQNFQVGSAFTANEHAIDSFDTISIFSSAGCPPPTGSPSRSRTATPVRSASPGSGLGYEDIHHSVAFTYDLFPAHSRVGFFVHGDPAVENDAFSLDVTGSGIDFHGSPTTASDVFRVHIVFNGIAAQETITDLNTDAAFTKIYIVDIPALVGSSCAYLGFTGATGAAHAQQDILNWTFASAPPPALRPPGNLTAAAVSSNEIDLAWNDNSSNENAFRIEA